MTRESKNRAGVSQRWFTLMTDTVRAVLLTRRRRRQSYALSAINIDSDKSLKERAAIAHGGVDQKPAESARLIEIYVDNIGRAINTRRAELHKSISDSRTTNRIASFSLFRLLFLFLSFFHRFSTSWRNKQLKIHRWKNG